MKARIEHIFADGLYAKETHIPEGMRLPKHTHDYTHFSILAKGKVRVFAGEEVREYRAPACIEIKANVPHEVQAITNVTWYCVHATNEKDPERVDQILIQGKH